MERGVRRDKIRTISFLASAGLLVWADTFAAQGQPVKFVLAADDSYGVEDCLIRGHECGQTVADAWCEAHGQGKAIAFGVQEAALGEGDAMHESLGGLEITCGN